MKKVFLSLAIAAVFSLGFISCAPKATEEEVDATETEVIDEPVQDVEPAVEPAVEPEAEAEVVE